MKMRAFTAEFRLGFLPIPEARVACSREFLQWCTQQGSRASRVEVARYQHVSPDSLRGDTRQVVRELGAHAEAHNDELARSDGVGHGQHVMSQAIQRVAALGLIGGAMPAQVHCRDAQARQVDEGM